MKHQVTVPARAGSHPGAAKLRRASERHEDVAGGLSRTVAPAETPPGELRELERIFANCRWPDRRTFVRARERARERALEVLDCTATDTNESRIALFLAAAEMFAALDMERSASPRELGELAQRLEEIHGIPRMALARVVLRGPELLDVSPDVAVEARLATLAVFARLRNASLWTLGAAEHARCVCHVGEGSPSRGMKQVAERLFAREVLEPAEPSSRRLLLGIAVGRQQPPLAVLVASARLGTRESSRRVLAEGVPLLAAVLERDALLSSNADSERALLEASERKLTRLGFDLHDGPIQDVALLAEDLRLFRDQLEQVCGPVTQDEQVRGRIDDLDGQLVSLDADLRRISREVQAASVLMNRPFDAALRDRVKAFAARTGIEPRLTLTGDTALLSTSQQIALLNIVQEGLSNIREHADATDVAITLSVDANRVEAMVIDNGGGFDLESALIRAAREGRIGLLGMHERVRLLGGQCRIDSRPGGPTAIVVNLERWVPVLDQDPAERGLGSGRAT